MKRLSVVAGASILVGAGLLASVAISQEGRSGGGMMQGQQGMHGMIGGMIQGCPMMSGGASQSRSTSLIPQLPPGNEKLQAQMTAEIMQKAGEIASKYAAQAK